MGYNNMRIKDGDEFSEDVVIMSGMSPGCVRPKNMTEFETGLGSSERHLPLISILDSHVVVSPLDVQLVKCFALASDTVLRIWGSGAGIGILHGQCVKLW